MSKRPLGISRERSANIAWAFSKGRTSWGSVPWPIGTSVPVNGMWVDKRLRACAGDLDAAVRSRDMFPWGSTPFPAPFVLLFLCFTVSCIQSSPGLFVSARSSRYLPSHTPFDREALKLELDAAVLSKMARSASRRPGQSTYIYKPRFTEPSAG
jgi:hypothetical protein